MHRRAIRLDGRNPAGRGARTTMADATSISLARALKLKNRVVHRLSQLDGQIVAYNSALEDHHEYDIRVLYKAHMAG